jgi:formylglycine-generating enzyme required for sulfatase activity
MSETEEPQPTQQDKKVPYVPGQPLPRLWKTEPDPEEDSQESLEGTDSKKASRTKDKPVVAGASSNARNSTRKSDKAKAAKKKAREGEDGEKRVLIKETPAFDTIESRQRVRMTIGGLMVFCFLVIGWTIYRTLFPGSDEVVVDVGGNYPPLATGLPPTGPAPSREGEAGYMLDRARDYAKRDQGEQAVAMLKRIVSVYKGTVAAGQAQAALDRMRQNLPVFHDGPFVLAEQTKAAAGSSPTSAGSPPPAMSIASHSATGPPPNPSRIGASPPPQTAMVGPPPNAANPPGSRSNAPPVNMNPSVVGPTPSSPAPPSMTTTGNATTAKAPAAPPSTPTIQPSMTPAPGRLPPTVASANVQSPPANGESRLMNPPKPPPGPGDSAVIVPAAKGESAGAPPAGNPPAVDRTNTARAARMLPPGFRAKVEDGVHESGWPQVIVGERDSAPMVLVPGATFTMGSDAGRPDDGPSHQVRLSTYYIDQHEVTNRQFRSFLQEARYHGQPPGKWLTDEKLRSMPDDSPAVYVSYHDAEAYSLWALKRLPTEAQWELAARSVDGRRYPWGDQPIRWTHPRKYLQVDIVSSFPQDVSPYGVFDMAGNVHEWVRDWYDPRFFHRLRDKTTEDPDGPPTKRQGIQRSVRGASKDWLVYDRIGVNADRRLPYLGFRCSLAVEGGEASANIVPRSDKPEGPIPATNAPDPGVIPF